VAGRPAFSGGFASGGGWGLLAPPARPLCLIVVCFHTYISVFGVLAKMSMFCTFFGITCG